MSKECRNGGKSEDRGANWRVLGAKLVKRRQWASVNPEGEKR